ncbi:MAG: hypothetical protein L0L18_13570, partial [Acidipropionibacterium jensenii]|nr:hypothetical protein [Acidipropionibacterium jensenii]
MGAAHSLRIGVAAIASAGLMAGCAPLTAHQQATRRVDDGSTARKQADALRALTQPRGVPADSGSASATASTRSTRATSTVPDDSSSQTAAPAQTQQAQAPDTQDPADQAGESAQSDAEQSAPESTDQTA